MNTEETTDTNDNKPKRLPPENMPAQELWQRMIQMPRPFRVVDFPRYVDGVAIGQVAIWVLTPAEQIAASMSAEKLVRSAIQTSLEKTKPSQTTERELLGYSVAYENAASVELLFRACRVPDDLMRPAFPSAKAIREACTTDEIACLMESYGDVAGQVGPIMSTLSKAEADAWIDRLEEGSSYDPLGRCSSAALRILLRISIDRAIKSRTASSSAGSPLEGTERESIDLADDSLEPVEGED